MGPALTRVHRERLQEQGFISQVIPGWYIANRPDEIRGSSTFWYANLDNFVSAYATSRFGARWQTSAELSLLRHSGETGAIKQLVVHSPEASNQVLQLPHACSLLMYKVKESTLSDKVVASDVGLRSLPLEEALAKVSPQFFVVQSTAAQIALRAVDATELARTLLGGDHSSIAGRLVGALRAVGRPAAADDIGEAMKAAGHRITEAGQGESQAGRIAEGAVARMVRRCAPARAPKR